MEWILILRENWDLAQLIPRIIAERGSFANLSEEELKREIKEGEIQENDQLEEVLEVAATSPKDDDIEMTEAENDEEKNSIPSKSFAERRNEMVNHIKTALNESALSLDFVSLLISCQRPAAGTTSMSPLLKQRVAVGSLGADLLYTTVSEEDPKVTAGWKINCLNDASQQLKNVAHRVQTEVEKEETYWKGISRLAENGESLFKIRKGELRGLGIKYGFADAGSEYKRNRGIAIVKRTSGGAVSFKHDSATITKVVRVTLYELVEGEKKRVGSSSWAASGSNEADPISEIAASRAQIFEEELFYELTREQRLLASLKCTLTDGKLVLSLIDEIVEIEYVPQQEEPDTDLSPPCQRAELINQSLHLLLCQAHKRNLQKRQRDLPQPINSKVKKSNPPLFILRPLVAHILHSKILKRADRSLEMILSEIGSSSDIVKLDKYTNVKQNDDNAELGILAAPPISKYQFTVKGITIEITVLSPVQSSEKLFGCIAKNEQGQFMSRTGVDELAELDEWLRFVLKR